MSNTSTSAVNQPEVKTQEVDSQLESSLRSSLVLEATATAAELIEQLQKCAHIDSVFTKKQSSWVVFNFLGGFAIAVSVFITFLVPSIGVYALVLSGMFMIYSLWNWARSSHLNIPDRRHLAPLKLLRFLQTDIPANAPVQLKVDFRHYHSKEFQTGKTGGGFFSSIVQYQYVVPWLTLSSQFYDGTKFRLKITESVKRKEKQKRKRKKITETYRDKYNLSLAVKPARYPGLAHFITWAQNAPKPAMTSPPTTAVNGNRITLQCLGHPKRFHSVNSVNSDPVKDINADAELQLFVMAYACLGKCRSVNSDPPA